MKIERFEDIEQVHSSTFTVQWFTNLENIKTISIGSVVTFGSSFFNL